MKPSGVFVYKTDWRIEKITGIVRIEKTADIKQTFAPDSASPPYASGKIMLFTPIGIARTPTAAIIQFDGTLRSFRTKIPASGRAISLIAVATYDRQSRKTDFMFILAKTHPVKSIATGVTQPSAISRMFVPIAGSFRLHSPKMMPMNVATIVGVRIVLNETFLFEVRMYIPKE